MKKYSTPEIELVKFGAADIIRTSDGLINNGDGDDSGIGGGDTNGNGTVVSLFDSDNAIFK